MKKKCVLNHAMQEGLLLLLLGGWLLWYSLDAYQHSYIKDWSQSPSLFPVIVSCLLGLFGVIIFSQGMGVRNEAEETPHNTLQVVVLLGMTLAYYLALSVFEVATAVFLAAMMAYLGVRSKAVLLFVPVGTSAFLSVMFRTLLRVLLP